MRAYVGSLTRMSGPDRLAPLRQVRVRLYPHAPDDRRRACSLYRLALQKTAPRPAERQGLNEKQHCANLSPCATAGGGEGGFGPMVALRPRYEVLYRHESAPKRPIRLRASCSLTPFRALNGGTGGNRTPVRKPSPDGSTCVAV